MFDNIVTVVTIGAILVQLPISNAFCQLSDCSNPIEAHPGCPVSDFYSLEVYQPLDFNKPLAKDPYHMFNLLSDESERNCVTITLKPSKHSNGEFTYYFDISCGRARPYMAVYANYRQDTVRCFQRSNESLWSARHCNIFARERIRLNFMRERGLLLMEDLYSAGQTKSWLMLRKQVDPVNGEHCKCPKLFHFDKIFKKCFNEYRASKGRLLPGANKQKLILFVYNVIIGLIIIIVLLAVSWKLTDLKRCRSSRVESEISASNKVLNRPSTT